MHKKLWNKDFILMLQGDAVSSLGDILYSVAIGYWVYEKTGSSALMGVMSSISMFMVMFVMPFSGTIVDKCNRKAVIVGMDVARGIIMLIVGFLAFSDNLSVIAVLAAAFLASLCSVFFEPATGTLYLDIIPHDDMVRGQSIQNGVNTFLSLVGKAISGALVVFLGVPLVIVLNGVSYLISAVTELFVTVPKTKAQGEPVTVKGILGDFKIAIEEIIRNPYLRLFIPSALMLNLLGSGPYVLMLPFVLEKGFTVEMYGYLMSVETVASFLCVLLLGIVKFGKKTRHRFLIWGFMGQIFLYIVAFLTGNFVVMAVFLFLGNFANMLGNGVLNAALVLALPEDKRGALLGFLSSASTGGAALSAVVYGVLCDVFPMHLVFVAGTLLSLPLMAYMCLHKTTKEFVLNH